MDYHFAKFLFAQPKFFRTETDYDSYCFAFTLMEDLWETPSLVLFKRSPIPEYNVFHSNLITLLHACKADILDVTVREFISLTLLTVKVSDKTGDLKFKQHSTDLDTFVTNARIENLQFSLAHVAKKLLTNSDEALTTYKMKSMFSN